MRQLISINKIETLSRSNQLYLQILILVVALAVFQDYLFSQFRNTGFYISESLLYNSIWGFFIPLGFLELLVVRRLVLKSRAMKWLTALIMGITFSLLHITLFTITFVGVSALCFSPTHDFLRISKSAFSSHLHIISIFYLLAPYTQEYLVLLKQQVGKQKSKYLSKIKVKSGLKYKLLKTDTIQLILADKPYTAIMTDSEKYLDGITLKHLGVLLDPQFFIRVHRSAIINTAYIKELKTRKNGDYDATLENGLSVRLSRHYKNNWKHLLQ